MQSLAGSPTARLDEPRSMRRLYATEELYNSTFPSITCGQAGLSTAKKAEADRPPHVRQPPSVLYGTANIVAQNVDTEAGHRQKDEGRAFRSNLVGPALLPNDAVEPWRPPSSVRRVRPAYEIANVDRNSDDNAWIHYSGRSSVVRSSSRRYMPQPTGSIQHTDLGLSADVPAPVSREPSLEPSTPERQQYLKTIERDRKSTIFSDCQYPA